MVARVDPITDPTDITTSWSNASQATGIFTSTEVYIDADNKTFYFQFIIPSGYDSGGELNLVISKTNPILNIVLTAYVNGVPDATINATNIQPVVTYPTFEVKNLVFGTTLVPGNIVTVAIFFQGANNQDFWLRGISFKYNFNVI